MVEDLVVRVRGGASEYVTALAYRDLPTADLMQEWGDAVQYNPDIIKIKVLLGSCSTHPPLCSEPGYGIQNSISLTLILRCIHENGKYIWSEPITV